MPATGVKNVRWWADHYDDILGRGYKLDDRYNRRANGEFKAQPNEWDNDDEHTMVS